LDRIAKFNILVGELNRITEKYGLRFISGVLDEEDNIRTIVISDNEEDRDGLTESAIDANYGFTALVANKFDEEDLH
jgi:hypothetical protein